MTLWSYQVLSTVSRGYPCVGGTLPMHYSPFRHSTNSPKGAFACDLHALATPPAFVLSQDQTLQLIYVPTPPVARQGSVHDEALDSGDSCRPDRCRPGLGKNSKPCLLCRLCHEGFEPPGLARDRAFRRMFSPGRRDTGTRTRTTSS